MKTTPAEVVPMRSFAAARPSRISILLVSLLIAATAAVADDAPKAESPLVKLLKSGRAPEDRQGAIVDMIGKRGGGDDLGYIFSQAVRPGGFPEPVRRKALDALADAALTRKARPSGDLASLGELVRSKGDPALRLAAVRLAGLWKVEALGGDLRSIAESADADEATRAASLDALAAIGGRAAREGIDALAAPGRPMNVRVPAVAALARLDADAATRRAIEVLRDATPGQDLTPMMAALLAPREGADRLAAALTGAKLSPDAAKLALRAVYALGRSDASLVAELTRAAGIDAEVKPLDKAELDRLLADVAGRGDPGRGERIFRRADLSCSKCHALAGAGGGVGPDLSAVGSSSPADYLINSIMLPDQAIKEEFHTLVVATADGRVFHGIVVDKDNQRLVLKEATGETRTIPASEVEDSKEGGSLMPKGLVNLMTRAEMVDLVRFLSELGKPGPYAIHTTPTLQRWRVLKPVPDDLARSTPDPSALRSLVLDAPADHWLPAYALVSGGLPLDELTSSVGAKLLYLQGELDVSAPGPVTFRLDSPEGLSAWVDDRPMPPGASFTTPLDRGRHKLTLRVDTASRPARQVKVEVVKAEGSPVEFAVVGGR
jgi:putative heme-binding domain-containing protein